MATSLIKGCLFNMIIYTHEPRRTEYFHEIVHMVLEKFPSRVIFIEWDQEAKEDYLTIDEASGQCDQIRIKASKGHLKQVPFIVLKHLVPDLPIYLVWGQDPTSESEILPKLEKFATRLVYDSECTDNLQSFSREILTKLDHLHTEFTDVDWAMTRGWRDVIGQTFGSPEKHEILEKCNKVVIAFNKLPSIFIQHSATRAIYLQGWLAAQLGWTFNSLDKSDGAIKVNYLDQTVIIEPREMKKLPPGNILEVIFSTPDGHEVKITLQETLARAVVHNTTPERCELPYTVPLPTIQRGLAFMKEIFYFQTSNHYRNMLEKISEADWR